MKRVLAGAMLVGMLGCGANLTGARLGSAGETNVDAPAIQTSQPRYTLADEGDLWRLTIIATYKNETGHTVYGSTAGSVRPIYYLQKLEDGEWRSALAPAIALVDTPPTVIKNGQTRTDTLVFFAGKPGTNNEPSFQVSSIPGTYRVVYSLFATQRVENGVVVLSDSLAMARRTSNPFQLQ